MDSIAPCTRPGCGGTMKIAPGRTASGLACPLCGQPLGAPNGPDASWTLPPSAEGQVILDTGNSDQPLAAWVTDQVARRPVRLVTFFGRVPPLAPGLTAVRETAVTIDLPEFDQPKDQIPRGGHRLRLPLVVYRLEAVG